MPRPTRMPTWFALAALAASTAQAGVTLVEDGRARCAVVVDPGVMAPDRDATGLKGPEAAAEPDRRRLRESVRDLADTLRKMSGATIEILTTDLPAGDGRIPILIGSKAAAFGPPGKSAPYRHGFRLVVGPKGVGLIGESDLAVGYAIYELLDRLGCRWYIPGELGEVLPEAKTIAPEEVDFSSAPATLYRGVWYADDAFRRRNRHGGLLLAAGHALEMYITKEERLEHPEWVAEVGGKPHPHRLRWSSPTLADAIADKILAAHARDPQPSYSLSPDDGADWDESAADRALDAGDLDPTFQRVAVTDRLIVLCNRIAARVTAKYPDVLFGMLAYVDYTRPPVREKVHPNIVPQIAPINYSRAHPMTDDRVPDNPDLRRIIDGWGKAARMTSMYFYAYNLAETSAPNPMLTKWGVDVPYVLARNCRLWQPETVPNFETSMHALYLGCRLAWDPAQQPRQIIDELNARFYGHASKEMAAYWDAIDRAWVDTPEYSGSGFSYLRRWTPERLGEARRLIDAAHTACRTPMERRRVRLADESLKQFELFMKLRRDQAEGRFATLATDAARWRSRALELGEEYKENSCFARVHWTPLTVHGLWFSQFFQPTYDDATRIARDYEILTDPPLRRFRYQLDPEQAGEARGWAKSDFGDKGWKTTDVCAETWSTLGYHNAFKSMWYRAEVPIPAVAPGKKVYLWLGSTDGRSRVFVNGKPIPYVDAKGAAAEEASGYCQPISFDITAAIRPEAANSIAIRCTRTFLNELGTGGLLGPVVVYAEKGAAAPAAGWIKARAYAIPKETATEGEGYFSIIEGKDDRLYIGTHANGVNSWLVEFDPKGGAMRAVVDAHKAIGTAAKGFAAQAKIHTRNNVGASGKIYFGTKQGYPAAGETREDYPGGYPMVYDPATGTTKVFPIPVPHHGIAGITPDESHGVAYITTCSDHRPGPGENAIFLVLDLKTGTCRELLDTRHVYGFIVLDHRGRAYHPVLGGAIARYDPDTKTLDLLKQTIDGVPPTPASHLADAEGHPLNWDVAPDGKTLYCVPMSTNQLYAYDLTAPGDVLPGRSLGPLIPGAKDTDCRALCVGPTGRAWAATTEATDQGYRRLHLTSYRPGDSAPRDHGPVAIGNPDYTEFTDAAGKPLPYHGGLIKTPEGITTTRHVILGVCQARDGSVYVLALQPYTLLRIAPEALE